MQTDARIQQNHTAFQQLLDQVEAAVDKGSLELAMHYAWQAGMHAWTHSCGIFASPRLEALLARIGRLTPAPAPPQRAPGAERHVVTVMTQAYASGGHTPIACSWIANDTRSRHTLVITRQDRTPLPRAVEALVEQGRARLVVLDEPLATDRVHRLHQLFGEADQVVLHIHPNDPLPAVALAGMPSPPPVLLEDHANHVFWMGAGAANLLVALHSDGMRIAAGRRGIPRSHTSWLRTIIDTGPADTAGIDVRARFGIPPDAPLLVSCGAAYKFVPIDGHSLAALLTPVLAERSDVHVLLIGPRFDAPGTSLSADFPGRIHLTGIISQRELLHAAYAACDVYLDPCPFASGTSMHEAAILGKPVLKFNPQDWSDSGFTINAEAIPPALHVCHDADEYRLRLLELLDSPALRERNGRLAASAIRLVYDAADFQPQLEALYAQASQLSRIELDADVAVHRVELLDRLLDQLGDNRTAAYRLEAGVASGPDEAMLSVEESYRQWLAPQRLGQRHAALARARLEPSIGFHVLVVDTDGDAARLAASLQSVQAQSLPAAAITVVSEIAPALPDGVAWHALGASWAAACNAVAQASAASWLLPLTAGDCLTVDALLLLVDAAGAHPEWACCYSDEDALLPDGPAQPIFKPDLNLDLLRSYPYVGHTLAMRREPLLAAGGLAEQAGALAASDLVFRCIEQFGLPAVGHVAEVLLHAGTPFATWLSSQAVVEQSAPTVSRHLDRLGVPHHIQPGVLLGSNRVVYAHERQPPVSIIIPTKDRLPLLNGLIDSLLATTHYTNYELLIVDNDSRDPATCAYLDGIARLGNPQLRVLRWPHPFNYSAINNFAAEQARGEYLILLNNDTAVLHADWIEALLNHAQRPEVGIVGAKLHYPNGHIQHAGLLLGLHGPADSPFVDEAMDAPGYLHRLQVDQNCSAVSAACLMVRTSVYAEVGGLDTETFANACNDIDLCLKVRAAGYLTVWTPYARLMHHAGASHNAIDRASNEQMQERTRQAQHAMYHRWLPLLARDPAYNRNLGLAGSGYDIDQLRRLSWQPFEQPVLANFFCIAADITGCGHYRVMQPFQAMQREELAQGMIAPSHLPPVLMERYAPTSMVLQRQYTDGQIGLLRQYREFNHAFKVYELDDYMPNVPLKSMHRKDMPKDILKSLRKAIGLTDRFVVSTAPLAEAFADLHSDIRVVPNRLPVNWWSEVKSLRRQGQKPRVGWGGGSSHRGDLELIADIVRDLAGVVEWVFFGMCPEQLHPYIHEFHPGLPIEHYPAKLASMNLDLALAPLEDNLFNACKSNLRLLEYGACGFPVICSDIVCYRGDLPVTRVRNRYKEWMDAIRMHLSDLDAAAAKGDALREAVRRDWMLTGDNLVAWRNAWLPD
jgi:GT2 family glycosyltransferase/glycosyltransferase involved in cell wall biosynthesis